VTSLLSIGFVKSTNESRDVPTKPRSPSVVQPSSGLNCTMYQYDILFYLLVLFVLLTCFTYHRACFVLQKMFFPTFVMNDINY